VLQLLNLPHVFKWSYVVICVSAVFAGILLCVVDYIESSIVPAAIQVLDQDSSDEVRAEGVMVSNVM